MTAALIWILCLTNVLTALGCLYLSGERDQWKGYAKRIERENRDS